MAKTQFRLPTSIQADSVGPRLPQDGDVAVDSPVHALQQRIVASAITAPAPFTIRPAAMRLTLFVAVPLVMWASLFRAATTLI